MNLSYAFFLYQDTNSLSGQNSVYIIDQVIKKNKKNLSISPFPESLQERTRKEDIMRVIELYFPYCTPLHAHSHTHDMEKW